MLLVNKGNLVIKDSLVSLQYSRELEIVVDLMTPQAEMVEMVEMAEMVVEVETARMVYRVTSSLSVVE